MNSRDDSDERAETFNYLKSVLNETRASLGAEAFYREERLTPLARMKFSLATACLRAIRSIGTAPVIRSGNLESHLSHKIIRLVRTV